MHARGIHTVVTALLTAACVAPLGAQAAAPSNVTVAAGRGTVIVSWTAIRNTEVTYRVLRALKPDAEGDELTSRPLSYSVTSFVDATVAAGTTYFYWVIAAYPDGSEGVSRAVQFPAPTATVAPTTITTTTTAITRQTTQTTLTAAPTIPLIPSVLSATGEFNRVTLSWRKAELNLEAVSYEVRRATVDPSTPGALIGYLTASPLLQGDGSYTVKDGAADIHLPTWYLVTTKSATRGSVNSAWYRYNPTPHRGVDSIMGGYWRAGSGVTTSWLGCFRWSAVPGAAKYWARVRVGVGSWVDLAITDPQFLSRWTGFAADGKSNPGIFALLEGGAQNLEVQVGPKFESMGMKKDGSPPSYASDFNHLQPVYVNFVKSAVPLNPPNCQP